MTEQDTRRDVWEGLHRSQGHGIIKEKPSKVIPNLSPVPPPGTGIPNLPGHFQPSPRRNSSCCPPLPPLCGDTAAVPACPRAHPLPEAPGKRRPLDRLHVEIAATWERSKALSPPSGSATTPPCPQQHPKTTRLAKIAKPNPTFDPQRWAPHPGIP